MTNAVKETKSHKVVRLAIVRIEKGRPTVVDVNRKISVASVAEEAGLSRALIHRDCSDLVERINGGVNKGVRQQRDAKQEELKKYKGRNKELREEVAELRRQMCNMQSKNATILLENERLQALADKNSTVVGFKR